MSKKKFFVYLALCFYCLSACNGDTQTKKNPPPGSETHEPGFTYLDSSTKIYTIGSDKYILFDTIKCKIPGDAEITAAALYNGIYEFRSGFLERHKLLITKKLAFLTTSEDLGTGIRGHLYVFDLPSRSLVKDTEFERDYHHSSAGIFVVDPGGNKIFVVSKEALYEAKQESIIPASLYEVQGGSFKFIKNVYQFGNEVPGDTALLSFYKNSITPGGKGVFILSDDWYKNK